jgi:D-alanyl-D-alanine carboxypeptidase
MVAIDLLLDDATQDGRTNGAAQTKDDRKDQQCNDNGNSSTHTAKGSTRCPPTNRSAYRDDMHRLRITLTSICLLAASTAAMAIAGGSARAQEATFTSSISVLDTPTRTAMTPSVWRPGCPIGLDDLRLVNVSYWDFAGKPQTGSLVVHGFWAPSMVSVFSKLFAAKFPIERMVPIEAYGGDDDKSVLDNNTSAFNCRTVAGTSRYSRHSYGLAIDINPVQNPYVRSNGTVMDPNARKYIDRSRNEPGMIKRGDVVVTAFSDIGWKWGGQWNRTKDYQHFSDNGR